MFQEYPGDHLSTLFTLQLVTETSATSAGSLYFKYIPGTPKMTNYRQGRSSLLPDAQRFELSRPIHSPRQYLSEYHPAVARERHRPQELPHYISTPGVRLHQKRPPTTCTHLNETIRPLDLLLFLTACPFCESVAALASVAARLLFLFEMDMETERRWDPRCRTLATDSLVLLIVDVTAPIPPI